MYFPVKLELVFYDFLFVYGLKKKNKGLTAQYALKYWKVLLINCLHAKLS